LIASGLKEDPNAAVDVVDENGDVFTDADEQPIALE
ncbi:MAG: hypothetical protein ACJA14_002449, partial [Ilumatobacter sp.]